MFKDILKTENSPENIKIILTKYQKTILPFYISNGVNFDLRTKNSKISCRFFINPTAKSKVIIVNGYNESYLKYAETIYDLYHKGYSVYTYDHRGQGFSQKFKNQRNRGYLNNFDELIDDLELFFNFVNNHEQKLEIFMLAHSMGGAITAIAACQNKINPKRIVLSAPLFGIYLGRFSVFEYPIYLLAKILTKIGLSKTYAFGQNDCFPLKPFKKNTVTNSMARYQIWQTHIRKTPDVQLGGPTFQWVMESIKATRKACTIGQNNHIPILLLQAEKDTVVSNAKQNIFAKNCANVEKKVIENAKHEILMEVDPLRNQTLECVFEFFCCTKTEAI